MVLTVCEVVSNGASKRAITLPHLTSGSSVPCQADPGHRVEVSNQRRGTLSYIGADRRWRREPSQSWGSGGHRHWRVWVVGRQEFLPETGAERAVVEGAADLEQQIGPAPGPAHLLRLGHAAVHQEVGRALGQRRADPQPGPVPFGVIDQMGALGA